VRTLRSLNPHDFYVTIVKSNRKRGDGDAFKAMDKTRVEVVGSELLDANEAAVRLRIIIQADGGVDTRAAGLLLSRYNKYWRGRNNLE